MNLLYEKARIGGRMFRFGGDGGDSDGGDSGDSTDSSSSSATNGHDSASDSYSGGYDSGGYDSGGNPAGGLSLGGYSNSFSGYSLMDGALSPGGLGLTASYSPVGLNASYGPGGYDSYGFTHGLQSVPGQIGITTQPGMSQQTANVIGALGRVGLTALIGGPFGAIAGRVAQGWAERNLPSSSYSFGVDGKPFSGGSTTSAGSAFGSSEGSGGGDNMNLTNLFSIFTNPNGSTGGSTVGSGAQTTSSGVPGGLFPSGYESDPYGYLAKSDVNREDYISNFKNTYGLLHDEVSRFNDPAYIQAQRDSRMAEVQQQADTGYLSSVRDLERRGLNPNSGAFAQLATNRALKTAMAKVSAAAASDKELRGAYMSGLGGLSSMNTDFGKVGLGWGQLGLDATRNKNMFNLQGAELGLKANGGPLDWARLELDKYRADKGLEGTKYSSDASNDVNWGALAAGSLLNNDRLIDSIIDWF